MPELPVKEVRLPELHLPEIDRDQIISTLSGLRLPTVDLPAIERPGSGRDDRSGGFDWRADRLAGDRPRSGLAGAGALVRLGSRARPLVRSRWAVAAGVVVVTSLRRGRDPRPAGRPRACRAHVPHGPRRRPRADGRQRRHARRGRRSRRHRGRRRDRRHRGSDGVRCRRRHDRGRRRRRGQRSRRSPPRTDRAMPRQAGQSAQPIEHLAQFRGEPAAPGERHEDPDDAAAQRRAVRWKSTATWQPPSGRWA